MIKKVFHIILAMFLLTATNGYAISKHYCGDNLVAVSLFTEANDCCDETMNDDCCRNASEYFQIDQEYFIPSSGFDTESFTATECFYENSSTFKQHSQYVIAAVNVKDWRPHTQLGQLALLQRFLL